MRKWLWMVSLVLILMVSTSAWAAIPQEETTPTAPALTRGEFAALLVKAAGLEGEGEPAEILVQHGIMKGVPGKNEDLLRPIQRVEAAVLTGRTLGFVDGTLPPASADISLPAGHWAYGTYAWLTRLGLVSGDPLAVLSQDEGKALVDNAFQTKDDVIALLEKSQAQSKAKDITSLRTAMSGSMRIIPRPGVEGADDIPSLASKLQMVQEMVLPDKIHQITTVELPLPDLDVKELVTESYIVDGKMYQQLPDPETGELRWSRYPDGMVPDMKQIMEKAQQQTQVIPPGLEKTLFYKLLGTKELNGEQVYEIAFYGKVNDIKQFFAATLGSFGESQSLGEALGEASSIINSVSFWGITYIGVDDYLTRQADYGTWVAYAEKFQEESIPMEAIEVFMTATDYTYNEDINIILPEEVLAAPELKLSKDE